MRYFLYSLVLCLLPLSVHALEVEVRIEGLDRELSANARSFLSIEQERDREGLTPSRLRLLHKKAPDEIRQALQPFGYFSPVIESELQHPDPGYIALYKVDPGPQAVLSEVDFKVEGEGAETFKTNKQFTLSRGDALDLTEYESQKQALLSQVFDQGFLDAVYTQHEVRVDRDSNSARIILHLDTGRRYRFGEISFQQDVLDPAFLARYLSFGTGDPYSHEKLLDLQGKLIDSEYFSQVEVNSRRDLVEDAQIPVDIQLKPNKKNRYRIGLGFSTDTGPRLTLDWKRRRIGDEGHRMRTEMRLSKPERSLTTEYTIPLERPTVDYVSFGATLDAFDTETSKGNRALLNASHSIGLEKGWRRTLSLEYLYEDFEVGAQNDNARLLVPGITWSRVKGGGKDYIRRGMRLSLHAEGASDALLSTANYIQLYTSDKYIYAINDDWRLLTRFDLGATWVDDLLKLPPSKRFYAGGDNSVRGFAFEDLGPRDDNNDVVGGRYLAVGSLEVERHLQGKWSAAVFFDAGNAFDINYPAETAYGAGIGLRWRSPVGPIRFDLARGHVMDEQTLRLHIVLGPEL